MSQLGCQQQLIARKKTFNDLRLFVHCRGKAYFLRSTDGFGQVY